MGSIIDEVLAGYNFNLKVNKFGNKRDKLNKMNPLHKDQLKLSFEQYYGKSNQGIINIDELKRANTILSKTNPDRNSLKLLAHTIKNRNNPYEDYKDEFIHYEEFQNRIESFVSLNDKNDQTGKQLIFQLLDQDADGSINLEDLMSFLRSVGSTMEQKQVAGLLELMTAEGASLGPKEFQLIFQHF